MTVIPQGAATCFLACPMTVLWGLNTLRKPEMTLDTLAVVPSVFQAVPDVGAQAASDVRMGLRSLHRLNLGQTERHFPGALVGT